MVFGVNLSSFCESEEGRVLNSYVYFVYSTVKRYSAALGAIILSGSLMLSLVLAVVKNGGREQGCTPNSYTEQDSFHSIYRRARERR